MTPLIAAGDVAGQGLEGVSGDLLPLFRELGDLKRIRSADRPGSIADRLFADAWGALVAGAPVDRVMPITVAAAVAAARLGDLDAAKLRALGLDRDDVLDVLRRSFDAVAAPLDPALTATLRAALGEALAGGKPPAFVAQLARQPRAGVTCPDRPRIILQPEENHAEHCLVVTVYAVLVAPVFDADPAAVFLAAMAHHLHSAAMPDAGYSGEVMLGDKLDQVIETSRELALAQLEPALQRQVLDAIAPIADDASAEARAFHTGDVIDRVLETQQHLMTARLTMEQVLGDYGLVHDGPVKSFHDRVLAAVGLP